MGSFAGFVSPQEIMADVTMMIGDLEFHEYSEGSYMSAIQQALSELAFSTLFDEREAVIRRESLIVPLPEGLINIEAVFMFNGNECSASNGYKVWPAVNYFRHGGGTFRQQKGHNPGEHIMEDEFVGAPGRVLFYGTRSGKMHLSDACAQFENILIKYHGMGCAIGDQPIIPHQVRQGIKDWVASRLMQPLVLQGKRNRADLEYIDRSLHGGRGNFDVGSWKQAKRHMQDIDTDMRDALKIYLSNLSLKITR